MEMLYKNGLEIDIHVLFLIKCIIKLGEVIFLVIIEP